MTIPEHANAGAASKVLRHARAYPPQPDAHWQRMSDDPIAQSTISHQRQQDFRSLAGPARQQGCANECMCNLQICYNPNSCHLPPLCQWNGQHFHNWQYQQAVRHTLLACSTAAIPGQVAWCQFPFGSQVILSLPNCSCGISTMMHRAM